MKKWIIGLAALFTRAAGRIIRKWRKRKTIQSEVIDMDGSETQKNT